MSKPEKIICPFKILIDRREQNPWLFEDITRKRGGKWVDINISIDFNTLKTGDYSIRGMTTKVTVERKSISDFTNTLFHNRERFERELGRMQGMDRSCVIVEGSWEATVKYIKKNTRGNPDSIDATVFAFMFRYPKTHWIFRTDRYDAMCAAYRFLERYHRESENGRKD